MMPHRRAQMNAAQTRYRERNRERIDAENVTRRGSPEYRAWLAAWRKSPEQRAKSAARKARQRATPQGLLNDRIKAALYRNIKRRRLSTSWDAALGYTLAELKTHLERQFLPGMSWENASAWHIEHIIPISSFSFTTEHDPDFKAAWALTNLRPLWKLDNLKKGSRREHLL